MLTGALIISMFEITKIVEVIALMDLLSAGMGGEKRLFAKRCLGSPACSLGMPPSWQ